MDLEEQNFLVVHLRKVRPERRPYFMTSLQPCLLQKQLALDMMPNLLKYLKHAAHLSKRRHRYDYPQSCLCHRRLITLCALALKII